jgi:hypothetical protein
MSLRLLVKDDVVYEGPALAVPRVGEDISHDGEIARVEAVVWDFDETDDVVSVSIVAGGQPYTF